MTRRHRKRRHHSRRIRRSRRGTSSPISGLGGWLHKIARRPLTYVVTPAFALGGLLYLIFNPIGGDSWLNRLMMGIQQGDWSYNGGAGAPIVLANQLMQNALPSLQMFVPAIITGILGRVFKV